MAQNSQLNPHLAGEAYSELSGIITRAFRRYGNSAPDTEDGDTRLMFLDFANEIIDDIRVHPYWEGGAIDYYKAITEVRPIPDIIIHQGLLFKYAVQQTSQKQVPQAAIYFKTLNQALYTRKYGNDAIRMKVVDGGSNLAHSPLPNDSTPETAG